MPIFANSFNHISVVIIFGAILSYLLGSIPSAVWYGRFFHKVDVRTMGSGNAGATNTLRNLGKTAGIIVLLIDLLKGFLAVNLINILSISPQGTFDETSIKLLYGILAVVGHILPVFAGFRGGKGVATALGVILGLLPLAALVCIIIFAIIAYTTRYVSLGSILAAISFPISAYFLSPAEQKYKSIIAGTLLALIIIYKHKKNIGLLLKGQENKLGAKKD